VYNDTKAKPCMWECVVQSQNQQTTRNIKHSCPSPWRCLTGMHVLDIKERTQPKRDAQQKRSSRGHVVCIAPGKPNSQSLLTIKKDHLPTIECSTRTTFPNQDEHKLGTPDQRAHHVKYKYLLQERTRHLPLLLHR
jgi:hypothetical protein